MDHHPRCKERWVSTFHYMMGFELFPPGSYVAFSDNPLQWARFLMLPWLSIALVTAATYSRLTRSSRDIPSFLRKRES